MMHTPNSATGRTTVTLDADVRALLVEASHRDGKPFKATLNDAIRAGLDPRRGTPPPALDLPTFDMGAPLVDLTKAAALNDELADVDSSRQAGLQTRASAA